jgi:hypothetical protein
VGDRTEKELISAFVGKIGEPSPQLVTFNGNGFDLPVLRYREDALDLCDAFTIGTALWLVYGLALMDWPLITSDDPRADGGDRRDEGAVRLKTIIYQLLLALQLESFPVRASEPLLPISGSRPW